jgi:hypothetical protein
MSRRPDPIQPELNVALRAALRLAADSVEPTDDGLDKIQTKIVARKAARASRWRARPARVGGADESWWRSLRPALDWLLIRGWLAGALAAVVERFRPDPGRIGWLGWLRPVAAAGTGLFVIAGASWAVAALPGAITPHSSTTSVHATGSPTPGRRHSTSTPPYTGVPGGYPGGAPIGPGGAGSPSCSPSGSPSASGSPSGSPTDSGSPTSSGSPSPSGTPTDSGTPTPSSSDESTTPAPGSSTSQAPLGSPSSSPPADQIQLRPQASQSPAATGKDLLSAGTHVDAYSAALLPGNALIGPSPFPTSASASASPLPTATPTVTPVPTSTPTPAPSCP